MLRNLLCAVVVALPWSVKRWVLQSFFGYVIHPTARIGLSWFFPRKLVMAERAKIGHGNVAIHLERVEMGEATLIARSNWITGFPKDGERHFQHQKHREPVLILGDHAAITKGHHIDCTNRIRIGAFSTIAGYKSQLLTHSIDVVAGRQHSEPIEIGSYCFVGTDCIILGGAVLPDRSVLGAKSLLNQAYSDPEHLYAGVPARQLKKLPGEAVYFNRKEGFVV